jgi:hypothetical protein
LIESSPTALGAVRAESAISPATDFTASDSMVMQEIMPADDKKKQVITFVENSLVHHFLIVVYREE